MVLNGLVKPLQRAVGFGMLGIIEEMHEPLLLAGLLKVFGKFTTIVGLNSPDDKWSHFEKLIEEITATS